MKRTTISIFCALVFMFLPLSTAFAGDHAFSGQLMVGGISKSVDDSEAKASEYEQEDRNFFGGVRLNYDSSRYFLRFNAGETFDEEQKHLIDLDGGMWDKFRYGLFYNYVPHNLTFDAKTFYAHVGDSSLRAKHDPDAVSTWTEFDYQTERKSFGGSVSLDLLKPFFLTLSAQSEKKEGIKPTAFGDLSGPGGMTIELPEPVEYQTRTMRVEGGYNKKPYFLALSFEASSFTNDDQALDFYDVVIGGRNSVALPPDNDYYNVAIKGAVDLPANSRLSLKAATSHTESDADGNKLLGFGSFDGKVDTMNADIVLTSTPLSTVDVKAFYSFDDRENDSDGNGDHLGWTNNRLGGRVGLRLPAHLRLNLGYTYVMTDYEDRYDAKERTDHNVSTDLTWSGLDVATFKLGYDYRNRDSDRGGTDAKDDNDNIWRFDVAPSDRHTFKASADLFLLENLSLSAGYKFMTTDYEDKNLAGTSAVGLRSQDSHTVFVDASYDVQKKFRVYGVFDYEWTESKQRGFSSLEATDWKLKQEEKNYDFGIGADFYVIPETLTIKAQYDYLRTDGSAEFSYLDTSTPSGADLNDWGNYRKEAASIRAIYNATKKIGLMVGYAYEKLDVDDDQLDGYEYRPLTNAYLTGATEDPSYTANVLFMSVSYKF